MIYQLNYLNIIYLRIKSYFSSRSINEYDTINLILLFKLNVLFICNNKVYIKMSFMSTTRPLLLTKHYINLFTP